MEKIRFGAPRLSFGDDHFAANQITIDVRENVRIAALEFEG